MVVIRISKPLAHNYFVIKKYLCSTVRVPCWLHFSYTYCSLCPVYSRYTFPSTHLLITCEIYCRPFWICFRTQQEEKNKACTKPLVVFYESQINFLSYNGLYFDTFLFNKNFCVAFLFILPIKLVFRYTYEKLVI